MINTYLFLMAVAIIAFLAIFISFTKILPHNDNGKKAPVEAEED